MPGFQKKRTKNICFALYFIDLIEILNNQYPSKSHRCFIFHFLSYYFSPYFHTSGLFEVASSKQMKYNHEDVVCFLPYKIGFITKMIENSF
jgi:hypothetical protein